MYATVRMSYANLLMRVWDVCQHCKCVLAQTCVVCRCAMSGADIAMLASIDVMTVLDDVVRVTRCMPRLNWKAVRVVSPPTREQMRTLVALQGVRVVHEWQCDGPMVVVEAFDGDYTTESFLDDCAFVGTSRDSVAASLRDQNVCSMRVWIAAAIIGSLMGQARFLVASRASGTGHVVNVGSTSCVAVMRNNLVILFQRDADAPFDDAVKLHPAVDRAACDSLNMAVGNHELLFIDVQFGSGAVRRLYVELTPGQVSGLAVDATKAVFWDPPVTYSELNENPDSADGYHEPLGCPGWENHSIVIQKVCDVALSRELRQVPVDFVRLQM